jgi:DegV family protein with EDD domain
MWWTAATLPSVCILAEYALELVDRGMSAAEIAAELEAAKEKVRLFAVVDTLEYLQRGGRVSKTVAIAGGMLSVKPIIALEEGVIKMAGKARGNKQANAQMDQMVQKLGVDWDKPCMLGYTGTNDELLCKYRAQSEIWTGDVFSSIVSGVVGTHAGPGAVAVAFFSK